MGRARFRFPMDYTKSEEFGVISIFPEKDGVGTRKVRR
jgi:hypothetical protein